MERAEIEKLLVTVKKRNLYVPGMIETGKFLVTPTPQKTQLMRLMADIFISRIEVEGGENVDKAMQLSQTTKI